MSDPVDRRYEVEIEPEARQAIRDTHDHICLIQKSPQDAADGLNRVLEATDDLTFLPTRHALAAEGVRCRTRSGRWCLTTT